MFFVGLDLGQKQDFSAVAVVERERQRLAFMPPVYACLRVRYLERMPLGTPYTNVVERVRQMMQHPMMLAWGCRLVVDATGVGAAVVDLLRSARLPCGLTAVTITAGEQAHSRGGAWHVPKKDLLAVLQVLLEDKQLKICGKLREATTLVRELTDIRRYERAGGRVGMGAEGSGEHDDLAIAVALACWQARRPEIGYRTQPLF